MSHGKVLVQTREEGRGAVGDMHVGGLGQYRAPNEAPYLGQRLLLEHLVVDRRGQPLDTQAACGKPTRSATLPGILT